MTARARRLLRLIVIAYLFIAGLYATSIPPGGGPDETAHIRYVEWLAQHHRLPVFDQHNPGADYEFHQPPLYYLASLPAYIVFSSSGQAAALAVRFLSILIGLVLLYLTFALGRLLAPDHPWAPVAAAAVVAFLPMHLALVSSVGNDVLTEVFCAAALLLMVRYLRAASEHRHGHAERPPGGLAVIWVGVMIGLGLLTKSLAAVLLPVAWLTCLLAARGPRGYDWRRLLRDLTAGTGVALVIAGWWLLRNHALYGDWLAQKAFLLAFRDRPSPQAMMSRYHLLPPQYVLLTVSWTLASAIGVFGERFAFFPYQVYVLFSAKALAEAIGFVRCLVREKLADWQIQSWLVSALFAVLLLAGFIRFNLSFFQAQARYLFPALPPAAVAFCLGLQGLAPKGRGWIALLLGLGLLVALATGGFFIWIAPQLAMAHSALAGVQP